MYRIRKNGSTSNIERARLLQDGTGANPGYGKTAIAFNTSGLVISTLADNESAPTVYSQAGGTIQTIATLGTYAAPAANNCRFREVDATNNPGDYEFQFADARYAVSGAKSLRVTVSGVSGMLPRAFVVQLTNGGDIGVDATHYAGQATAVGADNLPKVGMWGILGTILSESIGGRLAAGFKWLLDVASPVFTLASFVQTGDSFVRLGVPAGASISADIAANLVAVQNVQNNTFIATTIPSTLERPDSGSVTVSISITFSDETGTAKNLDSGTPTITLVDDAGTDLSTRLGAWTNPATGKYVIVYTNSASDAIEGLHWDITGTINSKLRRMVAYTQIVDTTAVDFTSGDRSNLTAIFNKLPTNNIADETVVLAAVGTPAQASILSSVSSTISTIASVLSGITSLKQWLGAMTGKQTANAAALSEIRSAGVGGGTYNPASGSLEALSGVVGASPSDIAAAIVPIIEPQLVEAVTQALAVVTIAPTVNKLGPCSQPIVPIPRTTK